MKLLSLSRDRYLYFGSIAAEVVLKSLALTWLVGKMLEMAIWRNDQDPTAVAYRAHSGKLLEALWNLVTANSLFVVAGVGICVVVVAGYSKLNPEGTMARAERWSLSVLIDLIVLLQVFVHYLTYRDWVRYMDSIVGVTDSQKLERSLVRFNSNIAYSSFIVFFMGTLSIVVTYLLVMSCLYNSEKKNPASFGSQ